MIKTKSSIWDSKKMKKTASRLMNSLCMTDHLHFTLQQLQNSLGTLIQLKWIDIKRSGSLISTEAPYRAWVKCIPAALMWKISA